MIAAVSVTKRYGARLALDAVSFTAPDGSITGLLGPNGAGKTSTLRIASGLTRADAGRIDIGRNGSAAPTLGVLPHVPGLYGRLTVREHITYFGALRGMRGGSLDTRVTELIDQLDLRRRCRLSGANPLAGPDPESRARGRARAQASAPDSR